MAIDACSSCCGDCFVDTMILTLWICISAIGGATGQLLEHNSQALEQIAANFSACKVFAALISSVLN